MDKNKIDELKQLSFENALEKLDSIVRQMENGDLPLNQMMEAYEMGQILAGICSAKLKSIEQKVEVLRKKADGEMAWDEFSPELDQTRQTTSNSSRDIPSTHNTQKLNDNNSSYNNGVGDLPF
jgi:exodeoxyribonuclease VII small subunit